MSVTPARRDLTIWRGATFSKRYTYLESIGPEVPKDLTGWTGAMYVYVSAEVYVYPATIGNEEGTVDISFEAANTYTPWRGARYELRVEKDQIVETLLYGTIRSKGQQNPPLPTP